MHFLNVQLTFMLYNSFNFVFCDYATNDSEDAFHSTWSIIKSKIPTGANAERPRKRSATTFSQYSGPSMYPRTTEKHGYVLEIPVLQAPRSKYQNMYRMDIPSPIFNFVRGRIEDSYQSDLGRVPSLENDLSIEQPRRSHRKYANSYRASGVVKPSLENDFEIEQQRLETNYYLRMERRNQYYYKYYNSF